MEKTMESGWITANQADNKTITEKGWVSGPRWARIADGLKKGAMEYELDIRIEKESGLLTETVYYTITGKYDDVKGFQKAVYEAVE